MGSTLEHPIDEEHLISVAAGGKEPESHGLPESAYAEAIADGGRGAAAEDSRADGQVQLVYQAGAKQPVSQSQNREDFESKPSRSRASSTAYIWPIRCRNSAARWFS